MFLVILLWMKKCLDEDGFEMKHLVVGGIMKDEVDTMKKSKT